MEILLRATPYLFIGAIILSVVLTLFRLLVKDPGATIFDVFYGIQILFPYVSVAVGGIVTTFTVVQLAMLDLHADKEKQLAEEKKRYARLLLTVFILGTLGITPWGFVRAVEVGNQYGWTFDQILGVGVVCIMHSMGWLFWHGFRRTKVI